MRLALKRLLFIAVLAALVSGCATDPEIRPWWTLREANFRDLQQGRTTTAEARKLLGSPLNAVVFPRQGEEVWDYRYPDGTYKMLAWVYFDAQGVYKYYTTQLDPAYFGTPSNR